MNEDEFKQYMLEDKELIAKIVEAQFLAMEYGRSKKEWDTLCNKSWIEGKTWYK